MILQKEKDIYFFEENDHVIAEMTFSMAGEQLMIIDHTFVNDNYRGQGLGKKLLYELVDLARDNNIKIVPLCPFAASVFAKEKNIEDVLRK